MSCLFIRPILQEGKLPSDSGTYDDAVDYTHWADWLSDDAFDLVDARQLVDNWLLLFSKCNGHLSGTDLSPDNTAAAISETTAFWLSEPVGNSWPGIRIRHSHDGEDSALLAAGVILNTSLSEVAFGMFRSLTNQVTYLMFGYLGYEDGLLLQTTDSHSALNVRTPALPWNPVLGGHTYFRDSATGTIGTVRVLTQAMIPELETYSLALRGGLRMMSARKLHRTSPAEEVASITLNCTFVHATSNMFSLYLAQWAALVVL